MLRGALRVLIGARPGWDASTTKEELHRAEQEAFLAWRRQLAAIEESEHFILTPFERNLDIWRQLWRVVELSDAVVQIVDARNPEVFYCPDLVTYAQEVDPAKTALLLVNKADLLTADQRELWARHFAAQGIRFIFFSALAEDEDDEAGEEGAEDAEPRVVEALETDTARVFTRAELLAFLARKHAGRTVGLVGYPNVGKSSTINALMGEKKVAVALTPGKTKHFQTLFLGNGVRICDCPGLVFPNFAMTKSELVLNGILPVDQLRDYVSPLGLLAEHVPRDVIERIYGIVLPQPGPEEDPARRVTAAEILCTFALARGFMTSNFGNPDQSRASRVLLKDYVAGRILYCHSPPTCDQALFSEMTYAALRPQLPVRSVPKPHKPRALFEDEHMASAGAGVRVRTPGEKPTFAASKKHHKGRK